MQLPEWNAVHGLSDVFRTVRDLGLDRNIAELDTLGYTIVPPEQATTSELVDRLLARITEISADRNNGVKPDFETGATHSEFMTMTGQHLFYLLGEDQVFVDALLNPVVLTLATFLIGQDVVLSSATSMLK